MLDSDYLHSLFSYDPDTGVLTNKVDRHYKARIGVEVGFSIECKGKSYRQLRLDGKQYQAHRLIWLMMTGQEADTIDHIDGNGLNNRWDNLRSVSVADNLRNRRKPSTNTSGVVGVSWNNQRNKWHSQISGNNGKRKHLGYFTTIEEAAEARKQAEIDYGYHENHGQNRPL